MGSAEPDFFWFSAKSFLLSAKFLSHLLKFTKNYQSLPKLLNFTKKIYQICYLRSFVVILNCYNLSTFPAKFVSQKSQGWQKNYFFNSLLDGNSEGVNNLQSHDGLLDENAEEVYNLHHNLQSPDGLLDENSEEVRNLQWKMFSDGHQNSVSLMRTRPYSVISWGKTAGKKVLVLSSASVERFGVSFMRDLYYTFLI